MLHSASPLRTIPAPTAPQALSAPPPNTRVFGESPHCCANSGSSVPVSSVLPTIGGQNPAGRPNAFTISSLHAPSGTFSINVPAASEISISTRPVIR
ncbi:hypothetical protein D3C73_1492430 [compost metagenome]